MQAPRYAVVRRWKDNPQLVEVVDYFHTVGSAERYARTIRPNLIAYTVEVMTWN
jgi:hypothetical protein